MLKRNWEWSLDKSLVDPENKVMDTKRCVQYVSLWLWDGNMCVSSRFLLCSSWTTLMMIKSQEQRWISEEISTELSQINAPSSTELRVRRNNAMWWSITRFNHCVQLNLWHQICSIIFCHHIYYDNIVIIFSVVISSVSRRRVVTL